MKKRSNSNAKSGSSPLICSLEIDGRRYLIRKVDVHTKKRFEGRYKGYDINVWLDEDDFEPADRRHYIQVENPEESFGTLYDGWADEEIDNLEDAIKEALKGSGLIGENTNALAAPTENEYGN